MACHDAYGAYCDVPLRALDRPLWIVSALLFALVALVVLIAYGVVVGGVREDLGVWVTVVARLLAGSLPFIGLYAQLAWSAVGARSEPVATSLGWLVAYTVLFLTLAVRAYRREEQQKFA